MGVISGATKEQQDATVAARAARNETAVWRERHRDALVDVCAVARRLVAAELAAGGRSRESGKLVGELERLCEVERRTHAAWTEAEARSRVATDIELRAWEPR